MSIIIFNFQLPNGRTDAVSAMNEDVRSAWRSCPSYRADLCFGDVERSVERGLTTFTVVLRESKRPAPVAREVASVKSAPEMCARPETTAAPKKAFTSMLNIASLKSQFFAQVACVVISLLDQKVGIKAADGNIKTATFPAEGGAPTLSDNPFSDLSATIPAFAIRTAVAELKKEDIVLLAGQPCWVVEFKDGVLKVLRTDGSLSSLIVAENALFKDKAVMRVTNPFAGSAGGGLGSLLPLLMMGGDEADPSQLGMLLAMSSLGGAKGGAGDLMGNPMMLMALMGKGGLGGAKGGVGGIDMKTLMLMQMMGGKDAGAMNPMLLMALAG